MNPNILVLDIETAPGKAYIWSLRDEYIPLERLIEPGRIVMFGAKWVGRRGLLQFDERDGRKKMLASAHALMSKADALVTYNGDSFDLRKLNGEFLLVGLSPLPPMPSIDLYKTARGFGLMSGKLDYMLRFYNIGQKMKHAGFPLWRKVMEGDDKAWRKMGRYNAQDVRETEKFYLFIRPYIKTHPYLGPVDKAAREGTPECPRCGSHKHQFRGKRRTKAFLIQRIQCLGCGGWYEGKKEKV